MAIFTNDNSNILFIGPLVEFVLTLVGCVGHALMNVRQVRTRPARVRPRKRKDVPVSLNGMTSEETVQGSLGVANAVELVKLILLNSSLKAEVPRPLVDALRRCEESHIFAAFTFIRNKELVVSLVFSTFFPDEQLKDALLLLGISM